MNLRAAKQFATAQLKEHLRTHGDAVGFRIDLREGEGIWAKGSHAKPIEDKPHYARSFDYIRKHDLRGAAVTIPPDPHAPELTEEEFLRDFGLLE